MSRALRCVKLRAVFLEHPVYALVLCVGLVEPTQLHETSALCPAVIAVNLSVDRPVTLAVVNWSDACSKSTYTYMHMPIIYQGCRNSVIFLHRNENGKGNERTFVHEN